MRRAATVAMLLMTCGDEAPPVLAEVPVFTLVDQDGEGYGAEDLRGKPWIASFIFTRCPSVCPMLTSTVRNLQGRLEGVDIRFVSFSVDPENDTPEVLRRYADSHGADLSTWHFLTGSSEALRETIEEGLRVSMGVREGRDITHGTHLVLVDAEMHVRGYYRTDAAGLERLETDARLLGD